MRNGFVMPYKSSIKLCILLFFQLKKLHVIAPVLCLKRILYNFFLAQKKWFALLTTKTSLHEWKEDTAERKSVNNINNLSTIYLHNLNSLFTWFWIHKFLHEKDSNLNLITTIQVLTRYRNTSTLSLFLIVVNYMGCK